MEVLLVAMLIDGVHAVLKHSVKIFSRLGTYDVAHVYVTNRGW